MVIVVVVGGVILGIRAFAGSGNEEPAGTQPAATGTPEETPSEVPERDTGDEDDLAGDDEDDEEIKVAEGPCADSSLTVRATIDRPEYPVADQPRFGVIVTNIGDTTCARDLGAAVQQISVRSVDGDSRVWVNTDCSPPTGRDVWTLAPGDQAAFAITWSGTASAPGCFGPREPVGPGRYRVIAQVGEIAAEPVEFEIVDPREPEPEPTPASPTPVSPTPLPDGE